MTREVRPALRHLIIEFVLRLTTPCHLGGPDADATSDLPLVRDAGGRPFLPGTTLCGLLRASLTEDAARALFGGAGEDDRQSPLIVEDAPILGGPAPTELRDGVAIDEKSGVAEDGKKYDLELLPVGTCFQVRLQLDLADKEADAGLIGRLLGVLRFIEEGRLGLGARQRRGLGRCQLLVREGSSFWLSDYRMRDQRAAHAWLALGRDLPGWPTVDPIGFAGTGPLSAHLGVALIPVPPERSFFDVALRLRVNGSLLVRSGGHEAGEPDMVHLRRLELGDGGPRYVAVLPGTSLAGVLRHRCALIARTLAPEESPAARQLIEEMFGSVEKARARKSHGRASRVIVSEARLSGGRVLRHTRVSIDPWTGGAREGLLFTADAAYGGELALEVRLREPRPAERALLLLALRDLAAGELPVGGEGGTGRGRLRAPDDGVFATLSAPDQPPIELRIDEEGRVSPAERFAEDMAALMSYLREEVAHAAQA
jgi:CRISPR/Cas system CSM-associated protein Csm3 (group 7 of RAMP superfamily)